MEAADGLPVVGPTAKTLGVRPGNASYPDVTAVVPGDTVVPGTGGMSVAPDDPRNLPWRRKPVSLGGKGREPVWEIAVADLGSDLVVRFDAPTHGLIEPDAPMTLQSFQDALARTHPWWRLCCR